MNPPFTIRPDSPQGHFVVLDNDGNPISAGIAQPSRTIPGYVTLRFLAPFECHGAPLRVPVDWIRELSR